MRLWSRGLGRLVLPLELGAARVDVTPDHVVLSGVIREGKVAWDYTVKMREEDFLGFARVLGEPEVLHFLARHHGARLLWTIGARSGGFLADLWRAAIKRGVPVVSEDELPLGPEAEKRGARNHGVLVQRTR